MKHPGIFPAAIFVLLSALGSAPGCSCTPSAECQLIRSLCKIDVCIRTDSAGWHACQGLPDQCDFIEGDCTTRAQCIEGFMDQCTQRMASGGPGYVAYSTCATLDCAPRTTPPPPMAGPDAAMAGGANGPYPDAARPEPDAAPGCAGVMCDGACCTAYPCFSGKTCRCLPSTAACSAPDAGDYTPPAISPSCCSDAPLCAAQNRQCCFISASAGTPAETRCMTKCVSETRHCTYAPYLQADGMRSCLPPPYDQAGVACPF